MFGRNNSLRLMIRLDRKTRFLPGFCFTTKVPHIAFMQLYVKCLSKNLYLAVRINGRIGKCTGTFKRHGE
jgi:hypothetical protein